MAFRHFFLSIVLIFGLSFQVSAQDAAKHVLDNGLTVIIKSMPSNPMVSVYGLIKAGGATEGKYLGSGLSHFLEHMLFKGTEHHGVGDIGRSVQAAGGSINAMTSYDYTMFTITVPKEAFETAVDLLADALFHSSLDAEEIEKERKVVFGEMRLRKDNPDVFLNDLIFRSAYLNHPYKHPVIGYPDVFANATRDDLLDFYKTFYIPNNIVISIAGSVDEQAALEKVTSVFGAYERKPLIVRNLPSDPWPVSSKSLEEFYPTDLTRIAIVFPSVALMDKDLFALDVLAKILGQGASSRLYNDLYQKQNLVYSVSAYNDTPYDRGIFAVEALLDDDKHEKVQSEIFRHIEAVREKFVTKQELEKAKKQVESEYLMGHQTTSETAYSQAMDEALTGDHLFAGKYVEGVRAVTADEIRRAAQKYLISDHRTVIVLRPESSLGQKQVDAAAVPSPAEIEKKILSNGIVVLLREDHTFPLVDICLSSAGGLRQETQELNGISAVTAHVWLKGTKSKSAQEIARFAESNGMSLSDFSGRNSLGLRMEVLSRDVDQGLALLEDLVKNPVFPEEEIEKSRELLKAAIRQRPDDIFAYSSSHLRKMLFQGHPYRMDEEGTPESLDRISRSHVLDFYNGLVVSRNMVLSVYGDIDKNKIWDDIEQRFGNLKDQKATLASHDVTPPAEPQDESLNLDKTQALVLFGFQGPSVFSLDQYGLEVLTSILGSSFSGRLFFSVRDVLGKAYSVGGQFSPGMETGQIMFYVLTMQEDVPKVKEVLTREILKIQEEAVSEKELADAKNYLKGSHKSGQQTNGAMSFQTSLDELYGLGYDRYQSYDNFIDKITTEDIQRLAKQYLDLNRRVVVITLPSQKGSL